MRGFSSLAPLLFYCLCLIMCSYNTLHRHLIKMYQIAANGCLNIQYCISNNLKYQIIKNKIKPSIVRKRCNYTITVFMYMKNYQVFLDNCYYVPGTFSTLKGNQPDETNSPLMWLAEEPSLVILTESVRAQVLVANYTSQMSRDAISIHYNKPVYH